MRQLAFYRVASVSEFQEPYLPWSRCILASANVGLTLSCRESFREIAFWMKSSAGLSPSHLLASSYNGACLRCQGTGCVALAKGWIAAGAYVCVAMVCHPESLTRGPSSPTI